MYLRGLSWAVRGAILCPCTRPRRVTFCLCLLDQKESNTRKSNRLVAGNSYAAALFEVPRSHHVWFVSQAETPKLVASRSQPEQMSAPLSH
ncbi:hypothetical protein V8C35DRAFT_286772 [Trichoderma chlorosporum]